MMIYVWAGQYYNYLDEESENIIIVVNLMFDDSTNIFCHLIYFVMEL